MLKPGSRQASPLAPLLLTVFVDMLGFGIVIPILPLYAERFSASPVMIGALLAVYSAMGFLFSSVVGTLSDRLGRKSVLLLSTTGQAAAFLIMGSANAFGWLFVARTIDGVFGANVSTTQAYVADVTTAEERAKAMGLLGAAFGLGFICGPLLGGVLSQVTVSAPFYFAGALAAVNAGLIAFVLPESLPAQNRTRSTGGRIRTAFLQGEAKVLGPLMAAYFFMMFGFTLMTAFFAIFTEDRFGFTGAENGYVFALIGATAVLVQARLVGPLVHRFTEKRIAMGGVAILACALFALPLVKGIGALLLVSAGVATGNSLVNPSISGLVSRSTDPRSQGRVLGMVQAAASLGRCAGPVAGGWLLSFNPRHTADFGKAPFWCGSALLLAALLLVTIAPVPRLKAVETSAPTRVP
ncbi:MAG: MFS transporter [Verrucomicrobia bacterium]|nr:MFS transporter [Verrucomicrobiota bacterium]